MPATVQQLQELGPVALAAITDVGPLTAEDLVRYLRRRDVEWWLAIAVLEHLRGQGLLTKRAAAFGGRYALCQPHPPEDGADALGLPRGSG